MFNSLKSTLVSKTLRGSAVPTLASLALAAGVGYGMVYAERAMTTGPAPVMAAAPAPVADEAPEQATDQAPAADPAHGVAEEGRLNFASGVAGDSVRFELGDRGYTYSNIVITWNGQTISDFSTPASLQKRYVRFVVPAGSGTVTVSVSFDPGKGRGTFSRRTRTDTFTYTTPTPPVVAPAVTALTPWAGAATGGTTVVIEGTNLNGATAVSIGGAAATIVGTPTATELTVTTPAGTAGTMGAVTVTTPGGTSAVTSNSYFLYDDTTITWVLPSWEYNADQFQAMATALRSRIPDGPKAKIGISSFVSVNMNSYTLDPSNTTLVRAELQSVLGTVQAMAARSANLTGGPMPIGLSLITAIRDRVDGVQTAAEAEDRRNVQWYGDTNGSATGWVTFSQYAKKLRRYQEAYIREFGTGLKEIQAAYPTVPIIVTGDGEVEMTFGRFTSLSTSNPAIGDYSPFAIAEFRDWLRGTGAYGTGGPLEGLGFPNANRYTTDATPGTDTNGDGHTFNTNFGTNFDTWDLEVFGGDPWTDGETVGAIPTAGTPTCAANYVASNSTSPVVCLRSNRGFDAPRGPVSGAGALVQSGALPVGDAYWQIWLLFREQMVWRYNLDFAKWITEGTGRRGGVANTRFFSAQVPADKLFTNNLGLPNDGGVRLLTGASPHWVADIDPYGGAGVTGYNANTGGCSTTTAPCGTGQALGANGPFFKTTDIVAPLVSAFGRWGIVEWNPADPFSNSIDIYRSDVQTLRQYRPALLMPFKIPSDHWKVFDISDTTLKFEQALREMMQGRTDGTGNENHTGIANAGAWLPRITWANPARVLSGTTLTTTQLNATANVLGTFVYYSDANRTQVITAGNYTVSVSGNSSSSVPLYTRFTPSDPDYGPALASVTLTVDPMPIMTVSPTTERLFSGIRQIDGTINSMTGTQLISVSFSNPNNGPWTATASNASASWVTISNGSGTGAGLFGIGINTTALRAAIGNSATTATATVTVTATGIAAPTSRTIPIRVTLGSPAEDGVPIGQVDTPAQGQGSIQGSIGITGWVVDDRGVAAVKIYRQCLPFEAAQSPSPCTTVTDNGRAVQPPPLVFMGDANFVAGARPDIETLFPALPATNTAGWGFLVLTQMMPNAVAQLPNGGEGTFQIYVFAEDTSGKRTLLGRSFVPSNPGGNDPTTISLVNISQSVVKPFGAIDTPAQGATVSGVVNNFGWALTPDADAAIGSGDIFISQNGASTVFLNAAPLYAGNPLGQITFNYCRGSVGNPVPPAAYCDDDVSNIFGNTTPQATFNPRTSNPTQYRNLDAGRGPIGLYVLDTRLVSNGVYQLQWAVYDNLARVEGIGSRFITILNSGGDQLAAGRPSPEAAEAELFSLRNAQAQVVGDAVALRGLARRTEDLRGRLGFNLNEPYATLAADDDGVFRATVELQDRIEIDLGGPVDAGYLVANGTMRSLPTGSTLRDGVFHWGGVPGYLGDYDLVFVRGGERIDLTVTVEPEAPSADDRPAVRMHLDEARVIGNAMNGRTVEIGGWAFDPHTGLGSGIGAVHVWAKRVDVAGVQTPFFLGEATIDGRRPDVAAAYADAPQTAGFGLFATLAPGTYEISSYVWVTRTRQFEDARTVTITVR